MRKVLLGVVLTLLVILCYKQCTNDKSTIVVKEHSALIQEQLKNVGKLVVTEGHFSEVFNYENSKEVFGDFFTADKKALVVVNADVTIAYDLSKLKYDIDEVNKILTLISIPEEEIKISPDLEYYDVQSDFLNPFEAEDYNAIKETVSKSLMTKIENSSLKSNAKNRLISELSKFYILTNSLGWTLKYNETPITESDTFNSIDIKL
ncbi:DUF4230 domain-containing protein [Ichthyenterobacterium sp. W332]|uniref:DUF4230 domain-containing protein n=1 Tax=Microcosmobacter mediterraneus TaxID=3075607 RepID=A0ABU2YLQ7_9FLAO|nr:DUF4230 domain-containing protein [Ichthyenterobacterium sp. W332]MDT0559051.1 DUF4230 domain-containing protein [Ichthyenterobacterium sp. W332]